MTGNFHLLRDDPDTGDIYRPLRVWIPSRYQLARLLGEKSSERHNCFCRRSWYVSMRSVSMQYLRPHQCFTYDQHSWGTYRFQFQVHLYKLQRGIPYQMSYLQQGLHRRNKKTPGRSIQRTLTFNTTNQHWSSVGRHFASPGHASTDMLVSVIHSDFRDTPNRRLFEVRMIFKHKTLHPGGLNLWVCFLEVQFAKLVSCDVLLSFLFRCYTTHASKTISCVRVLVENKHGLLEIFNVIGYIMALY